MSLLLAEGPLGHPQFAMLAADLRSLCSPGAPGAPDYARQDVQAAFRVLVDRIRAYFLTQDGKPRKAKGFGQAEFKKDHCASEAAWRRHRDAVEAVAPGCRAGGARVPARPERHPVARRVAHLPDRARAVPPHARRARRARFLRGARPRRRPAPADGGVLAEPLQARGALSARAGRRVPGHEPRAVGARGAARAELGRGLRRRRRRAGAVDLRRRRPQAVDLRLP